MAWVKADQETARRFARSSGKVTVYSEEAVDDSDKTLDYDADVSEGKRLEVLGVRIEFVATATVGTRLIELRVADSGSDLIQTVGFAVTVTASQSKNFQASVGVVERSGTPNYEILPAGLVLLPGQTFQILDTAAIDAAADDMTVHVTGRVF